MFSDPRQRRVRFNTQGPTLTQQSSKDECDIHIIMRKAEKHGVITHLNKYQGEYSNMISAPNYHEAMVMIANANSMFETVPSSIRAKFGNDPARFLDFMQNADNRDRIIKMGLDASHLPVKAVTTPSPTPTPGGPAVVLPVSPVTPAPSAPAV